MKTLNRYIASLFFQNFLVAQIGLTLLFLFQAMFTDIYDHNYPFNQILFYHLLEVPQIVVQMAAPAVLLSTVITISGLSRTNELIACFSIGFGLRKLVATLLFIVVLISGLLLVAEDKVLPPVFKARTLYKWRVMDKKTDFFLDIKLDKIWYRSKNMIYNLQRFDGTTKMIHGMSVYTFDDHFNLVQAIEAEKAQYSERGWKLQKGTVTVFSADSPFPLTKNFDEKEILIAETPKDFQEIEKEVDGLKFKELSQYIQRMKDAGADTKAFEVKWHSRLSLGIIPIVMCFLAIPFSVTSRREGGVAKDLGICLLITFVYWLFYSVALSMGTSGALSPWLAAWLPSVIFLCFGTGLMARKYA